MNNYDEMFDSSIDKNQLDDEWIEQVVAVRKIGELIAGAEKKKDFIKFELEVLEAELDKIARGGESSKTTEAAIKNWVRLRPEYQNKTKELIEANYEYKMLIGLSNTFSHRKTSLEFITRLWMADYFGEPYNPEFSEDVTERQIKKQNKKLTDSILKRRNKKNSEVV